MGASGAGLPLLLQRQMSLTVLTSYRLLFLGYAALCCIVAVIYLSIYLSIYDFPRVWQSEVQAQLHH